MQRRDDGGLGNQLVGDKIAVNHRTVHVSKLVGEGGFSFVYLVNDISEKKSNSHSNQSDSNRQNGNQKEMVLKITSIHSRQQRDIAEKEAKLLSRLSHPSIIKIFDACYRTAPQQTGRIGIVGVSKDKEPTAQKDGRPQHMILMEYCEGGHALDVCNKLAAAGQRFDLSALIIAFGQICNAVSYLHAQRPPIVHRDLKPVNFLVKDGAYKLCDFGSAVFGHVELKTPQARREAEEVVEQTTTQMFRAPEMVDLYMSNKLTQSTDVWALGCCLYSLAFLQNCFEEGSNLAILNRNYKIPEDNPYGEGLVELIDRMLTKDSKQRADMTEVILCLSAIYSNRPLPPRKKSGKSRKKGDESETTPETDISQRVGTFRTDGQGIQGTKKKTQKKAPTAGKKLASDSAAARRLRGRQGASGSGVQIDQANRSPGGAATESAIFEASFSGFNNGNAAADSAFSTTSAFSKDDQKNSPSASTDMFGTFGGKSSDAGTGFEATFGTQGTWGDQTPSPDGIGNAVEAISLDGDLRRSRRRDSGKKDKPKG